MTYKIWGEIIDDMYDDDHTTIKEILEAEEDIVSDNDLTITEKGELLARFIDHVAFDEYSEAAQPAFDVAILGDRVAEQDMLFAKIKRILKQHKPDRRAIPPITAFLKRYPPSK